MYISSLIEVESDGSASFVRRLKFHSLKILKHFCLDSATVWRVGRETCPHFIGRTLKHSKLSCLLFGGLLFSALLLWCFCVCVCGVSTCVCIPQDFLYSRLCHLWIDIVLLLFFQSGFLLFHFYPLICLARNSSAMFNRNVKKGHPCLVSYIKRKALHFSSLGLITWGIL